MNVSCGNPNITLITTDYRLAPENPFPASIIDSLSVLDFVLENVSDDAPIHLCGQSAGGNLAAVTLFEAHRKYPGRIQR